MKLSVLNIVLTWSFAIIGFCGVNGFLIYKLPTTVIWTLSALVIIAFAYVRFRISSRVPLLLDLYLLWNIVVILRGFFVAEIYWDYKTLIGTGFGMLLPLCCYAAAVPRLNAALYRNLLKSAVVIFPIVLLLSRYPDVPGRFLSFFYLLLLCIAALPKKWKYLSLAVALFLCLYDIDSRSNVLRALVALLVGLSCYIFYNKQKFYTIGQRVFMVAPLVLFVLAVSGTFNIFQMEDYLGERVVEKRVRGEVEDVSLTADTRTFLYREVIESSLRHKNAIFGRTPARGYDSIYFTRDSFREQEIGMRPYERYGTEVSILNIYHNGGLIAVILYFLVFFRSSYLAIFKSNNIFIKLIGLFIAFRWMYAWVEDFNNFDINYAMLWMLVAMCFSVEYRKMTNQEFKQWIQTIIR